VAAVYSVRFFEGYFDGLGSTYTVPDGNVAIVRDIDAINTNLAFGPAEPWFLLGDDGSPIAGPQERSTQYSASSWWRGRIVFEETESFSVLAAGGYWHGRVCGYLLTT
jgi:hypothetical protein